MMVEQPSPFDARIPAPRERVWDVALAIAAGGAIGGAARYALNLAVPGHDRGFPWHTFIENALGSLLLGALMVLLLDVWPPNRYLRPFLGVGILGGFTTFSTYTSEARELLQSGSGLQALQYVGASVLAGLAGVWAGISATRAITKDRRRG